MRVVEEYARTVEDARKAALEKLGATMEDPAVEVEILDEGSKGVLGWGTKFARVRVTVKDEAEDKVEETLNKVLRILDLTGDIEREDEEGMMKFNIVGGDLGLLIGKRGQTLEAIQFLLNLISNKGRKDKIKVILDIEGYRVRREKSLRELARKYADRAKTENREMELDPMTSSERRIIHLYLQNNPYVETYSEGEEPSRRVVISPKNHEENDEEDE